MAKQTFTTGQVLTATQMNNLQANDYNWSTNAQTASYVLVAADKGQTVTMTNAAATTITVNTSLFAAGDTVRIINLGAGACTITAGTATVNTAASLVLPQYASGTLWFSSASAAIWLPDDRNAGLSLILSQTVGSAVSSVTVSNAFSSTYDNYLVLYQGGSSSATNDIRVTFGATATGYYSSGYYMNFSTSTINGQFINNGAYISAGRGTTAGNNLRMEVFGPNLADETIVMINSVGPVTSDVSQINQGFVNNTTQYTAFTLTPSTGTLTGGVIRVYGYQNS